MSLYQRGEIWWIDLRNGGRRVRRTTRTSDRAKAKRQHDELAARLWKLKATGKQLSDALSAWWKAKERAASAARILKQIRAEYQDRPLFEVTEDSIQTTFGDKGPGTYNRIAGVFRASLNIAHAKGWLDAPPKIARREEPEHEPPYLSAEDWKALRAELAPHLRPMADFAVATGLRWSNVAGLTWDRVSMRRAQAWIPARTAKGRRTIIVPLNPDALQALRGAQKNETGFVFTYRGKPLKSPKTGFNAAIRRANEDGAKIKGTWHTLRHTWASWHTMNGTPREALKELGAWRSMKTVERYAHLAPSYVAKFAGNVRPVSRKLDTKVVTLRKAKR